MNENIQRIEESIRRMTSVVRQEQAREIGRSLGEDPDAEHRPLGWWVLACGEKLDSESFDERELAREQLLVQVRGAGIVLGENVWVWDESGMAQLVVSTVPSLDRAEKLAKHLRGKGLTIRLRREEI